jgi:hypothetical protein
MPKELPGVQAIRLIDVFLLGPVMIKVAGELAGWKKDFLFISGIGTILLNGYNYLRYRRG